MSRLFIVFFCFILGPIGFAKQKLIKLDEVKIHSTTKDCWIVIKDKVYDISDYLPKHPAPESVLLKYCGKIADIGWDTKEKGKMHSRAASRLLGRFEIGNVAK